MQTQSALCPEAARPQVWERTRLACPGRPSSATEPTRREDRSNDSATSTKRAISERAARAWHASGAHSPKRRRGRSLLQTQPAALRKTLGHLCHSFCDSPTSPPFTHRSPNGPGLYPALERPALPFDYSLRDAGSCSSDYSQPGIESMDSSTQSHSLEKFFTPSSPTQRTRSTDLKVPPTHFGKKNPSTAMFAPTVIWKRSSITSAAILGIPASFSPTNLIRGYGRK